MRRLPLALGLLAVSQSNLPLGTGLNQPGNTFCLRDYASVFQVIPDLERVGFMGRGTFDFSATARATRSWVGRALKPITYFRSRFLRATLPERPDFILFLTAHWRHRRST